MWIWIFRSVEKSLDLAPLDRYPLVQPASWAAASYLRPSAPCDPTSPAQFPNQLLLTTWKHHGTPTKRPGGAHKPTYKPVHSVQWSQCSTEGMNMAQHGDSAMRKWLEGPWRSLWAPFWRMNKSYSGRRIGLNHCQQWGGPENTCEFCWLAACCFSDPLNTATTCPLSDAGLFTTRCPGPPIPSICQNTREGSPLPGRARLIIPTYLQLTQLRQHSHSGITGYLRVILLFELFVCFETSDMWRVDQHSKQWIDKCLSSIYKVLEDSVVVDPNNNPAEKEHKHK